MDAFFNAIENVNGVVNSFIWGVFGLALLIGTGILMTCCTKFFQVTHIGHWFKQTIGSVFKKDSNSTKKTDKKSISQFQALCTALAATIGTGNIAGVAAAIVFGGPGAVFWMWVAAFFGMMTNFSENVLGIYFRRRNQSGEWSGGAMYYLKDGLGKKKGFKGIANVLAVLFAVFAILASFGIGNMGQVNKITSNLQSAFFSGPDTAQVVNVDSATLYAVSGDPGDPVAHLDSGANVTVLSQDGGWLKVQAGDNTGFVAADHLSSVVPGEATVTPESGIDLFAVSGNLGNPVGTLVAGETVSVLKQGDNWLQVQQGDLTGFVAKEAVTIDGTVFGIPIENLVIGVILMIVGGLIVLGGLQRIAAVAERLVPFMAIAYILGALAICILNIDKLGDIFASIFRFAFGVEAVAGGALGVIIKGAIETVTQGCKRGVFSNEAGLGSSVMVHSSSNVKEPVRQGMWGIFEVFFDTMIVCTMTAVVVLSSKYIDLNTGTVLPGTDDATLVSRVFGDNFGFVGETFIAIAMLLFAFTTVLGWSQYGSKAVEYLFGAKGVKVYKVIFVLMIVSGAVMTSSLAWDISDTFNGLMMIPNLIGVIALAPLVAKITKNYINRKLKGKAEDPMLSYDPRIERETAATLGDDD